MSYSLTVAQRRSLHPAHLPLKAQRRLCASAAADVRGKALLDIRGVFTIGVCRNILQPNHIFVLDPHLGIKHLQSSKTLCVRVRFCARYNTSHVYTVYFHAVGETATNGDGSRRDSKDKRRRNILISTVFCSVNRAQVV